MSILILVSEIRQNYLNALKKAGFEYTDDCEKECDGLLLTGGGDISPCAYDQVCLKAKDVDLLRDQKEFFLLEKFLKRKKPVLGICRGLQVINVHLAGSLFQDVKNHAQANEKDRLHLVKTLKNSFMEKLYGKELTVNSAHHQAIKKLGKGLKVSALSKDGIIEAVESANGLALIASQFHPERMGKEGEKVFEYFKTFFA